MGDVALIDWSSGNDFDTNCGPLGCSVLNRPPSEEAEILQRGRDFALGFAYWIQNEVPRDDGSGLGYPDLLVRTDMFEFTPLSNSTGRVYSSQGKSVIDLRTSANNSNSLLCVYRKE